LIHIFYQRTTKAVFQYCLINIFLFFLETKNPIYVDFSPLDKENACWIKTAFLKKIGILHLLHKQVKWTE